MPKFKYMAKNENGKQVRGIAEAPDAETLYQQLRTDGLFLLSSEETDESERNGRFKPPQLADFCRQMGTLLQAGVSMVRALTILASEEGIKPPVKAVYSAVILDIRKGNPLSEAMAARGGAFPTLLVSMVRSAEGNGNIDQTMVRMADHYDKEFRMQQKVQSAMMYPAILAVLLVAVVIFILTFIIPQFQPLFDGMEVLPLPTQILLNMSEFMKAQWPLLLLVVVLVVMTVQILLRVPAVRLWVDKVKLHMPIVGKLLRKIYTARFARTLASLYASGMPIVMSLQTGSNTIGNTYIASQFDEVLTMVRGGDTLSSALATVDGFEKKLTASIAVGEETGALDNMLEHISDNLDYEAEQATQRLTALLEPVMIVTMALLVGFILVAVILPIYQSYAALEGSSGAI